MAGRGGQSLRAGPGSECDQEVTLAAANPLFVKTKLCKFFAVGACSRGDECRFAHGRCDQVALPDFTKTQLCPSVLFYGVCEAPDCKFAHSKAELRPRVDRPSARAVPAAPDPFRRGGARAACPGGRRAEQAALRSAETPKEAVCSALRPGLELLVNHQGAGKNEGFESPGSQWSRQTTAGVAHLWASDDQESEAAEFTSDSGIEEEEEGNPPLRLEVRNTFLTVVDGEDALSSMRKVKTCGDLPMLQ